MTKTEEVIRLIADGIKVETFGKTKFLFCPFCDNIVRDDAKFCDECGARLIKKEDEIC